MPQLITTKNRLGIDNTLGLALLIVFSVLLLIAMPSIAEVNYVVKIPPMSIFNVTNLSSNTSFSYTYTNMTGGIAYLPPAWYYYYNFSAPAGSYIDYSIWSTSPVTLYIFTKQQFMKYFNGNGINEYLYSVTGSNVTGYYRINTTGTYYVVIANEGTSHALVIYAISLTERPVLNQWGIPNGDC